MFGVRFRHFTAPGVSLPVYSLFTVRLKTVHQFSAVSGMIDSVRKPTQNTKISPLFPLFFQHQTLSSRGAATAPRGRDRPKAPHFLRQCFRRLPLPSPETDRLSPFPTVRFGRSANIYKSIMIPLGSSCKGCSPTFYPAVCRPEVRPPVRFTAFACKFFRFSEISPCFFPPPVLI